MTKKEREEAEAWAKRAVKNCGKQLEESAVYCGLFTSNFEKDPLCALQLGVAILLDKPIFIMACDDQPIPAHLMKIAIGSYRVRSEHRKKDMELAMQAMNEALTARGL